jgi:hypothetical protein
VRPGFGGIGQKHWHWNFGLSVIPGIPSGFTDGNIGVNAC